MDHDFVAAIKEDERAARYSLGTSLRKSSSRRKGSKSAVLPKPKARRRCIPAPSIAGLALTRHFTARIDMLSLRRVHRCRYAPRERPTIADGGGILRHTVGPLNATLACEGHQSGGRVLRQPGLRPYPLNHAPR